MQPAGVRWRRSVVRLVVTRFVSQLVVECIDAWATVLGAPPDTDAVLGLRAFARIYLPQVVGNERRERLPRRVPPTDTKRMPSRVRIHLVAFGSIEIRSCLEQPSAEGDCLFVCSSRLLDVQIEMHLLGASVRPLRRNVVGCQLHADSPISIGVNDAVPVVVLEDVAAENASPERALGM